MSESMNYDGENYIAVDNKGECSCIKCALLCYGCSDCDCPTNGMHWEVDRELTDGAGI